MRDKELYEFKPTEIKEFENVDNGDKISIEIQDDENFFRWRMRVEIKSPGWWLESHKEYSVEKVEFVGDISSSYSGIYVLEADNVTYAFVADPLIARIPKFYPFIINFMDIK
jgi:hypothetical protein